MSQVAIDKIITVPRSRIGQRIGRLSDAEMAQVTALLAAFLGMG
jgi:mRNA interferase MazF